MNNNLNSFLEDSTGSTTSTGSVKLINYKLGEFNIVVKVNEKNEFIGIDNISVGKIFYDYKSVKNSYDVSEFYRD